jgi:hypothetical protein
MQKILINAAQLAFCLGLLICGWDLVDSHWLVRSVTGLGWLNPELTVPLAVALSLWFVGDVLLYFTAYQDYRKETAKIAYVLQQINCLIAGVVALAPISHWTNIGLRLASALGLIYVLFRSRQMELRTIAQSLNPLNCLGVWAGRFGPTAGWLVGTELMAWAVSMFGVCIPLGWALLAAANLWLARWTWLDMQQGANVGVWLRINLAFMSMATLQFGWAVWTFLS